MSDPRTLLVVEDDIDVREIVCIALRNEGYRVLGATGGEDALEQLRAERPELILLDLRMPGMSGAQFRAEQLKTPEIAGIPVVILSADAALGEIAASLQVAGYLKKPIQLADLLRAVRQHAPSAQ